MGIHPFCMVHTPRQQFLQHSLLLYRLVSSYKKFTKRGGNFFDVLKILAVGGKGGSGSCAVDTTTTTLNHRVPCGGNGGRGGDVYIVGDASLNSLSHLARRRHLAAGSGGNGAKNNQTGQNGSHLVVNVPLGTVISQLLNIEDDNPRALFEIKEDEEGKEIESKDNLGAKSYKDQSQSFVVLDDKDVPRIRQTGKIKEKNFEVCRDGERWLLAKGGGGGRGNVSMANEIDDKECGYDGELKRILMEVHTIADVGLVGFPNAGKSSFLAAVSNAEPKIASYPFTTLSPYVGVVDVSQCRQLRVADIPGLIEDAHLNRGLGHEFLRHIVKAKAIFLVIDISGDTFKTELKILIKELEEYEAGLSKRVKLIIANKADLLNSEWEMQRRVKIMNSEVDGEIPVFPASALHNLALNLVVDWMNKNL